MDQKMLSDEELNRLLSRAGRTRPVNRTALDDGRVSAALDELWSHIESSGTPKALPRMVGRPPSRRRLATIGVAAAAVGLASLVGVEMLTGGAGGVDLPLAVSPAAAAEIKKVAHAAAAQVGPAPGQWEYVESDSVTTEPVRAGGTTVRYITKSIMQTWYALDGTTRMRTTDDGGSFATPQDQATYEAHKSAFDRRFIGHNPTAARGVIADSVVLNDNQPQEVWLANPTSDPKTLVSEITASERPSLRNPAVLWVALLRVLLSSPSPRAHATAFAALSYVPGTKVVGGESDHLGRAGTAISFTNPPEDSVSTLIVSPSTGEVLEDDETFVNTGTGGPTITRQTFTQQSVVGSDTALPGGGSEPLPAGSKPISVGPVYGPSTTPTSSTTSTAPYTSAAQYTSTAPQTGTTAP